MNEKKIESSLYVPLATIGFLSLVLILASVNLDWFLQPLDLTINNRLALLMFSLIGGVLFFTMVTVGYIVWKGSVFIVDKLHGIITRGKQK